MSALRVSASVMRTTGLTLRRDLGGMHAMNRPGTFVSRASPIGAHRRVMKHGPAGRFSPGRLQGRKRVVAARPSLARSGTHAVR